MDEFMISIGKRIKQKRKELGLTQTEIYHKCGIASGALSQIENGSRTPSVLIFYKLSCALHCNMEWLITGDSSNMKSAYSIQNIEEDSLLQKYRKLPAADKEELLELIDFKLYQTTRKKKKTEISSDFTIENLDA